jgi:hypothetical protein
MPARPHTCTRCYAQRRLATPLGRGEAKGRGREGGGGGGGGGEGACFSGSGGDSSAMLPKCSTAASTATIADCSAGEIPTACIACSVRALHSTAQHGTQACLPAWHVSEGSGARTAGRPPGGSQARCWRAGCAWVCAGAWVMRELACGSASSGECVRFAGAALSAADHMSASVSLPSPPCVRTYSNASHSCSRRAAYLPRGTSRTPAAHSVMTAPRRCMARGVLHAARHA